MLHRIPARLTASVLTLLALIVVTAVATGYYLAGFRADSTRIQLVVRQTARVVALGRHAATYSPEGHAQASARIAALRQAFEQTHEALTQGGKAPVDDSTNDAVEVRGMSTEAARDRLGLLAAQWKVLAGELDRLVASKGADDEARAAVLRHDLELRDNLDATATMLRSYADDAVAQLFWIQTTTTGSGFILVLLILWGTRRDIGLPLRRLVKAAETMTSGDLASPIDTTGLLYETAELAQSFERLRLSLVASARSSGEPPLGNDDA